jgi:hypothetical protein
MKTLLFIGPFLIVLFLGGCDKRKDPEEQRLSWSTESPLTIPYRIRLQRLEKKNLLRNNSFETGRTFKLDSTKTSFVMDGWQQIGEHIEWVDTRADSLYDKNEAISGFRAVKITRRQAFETDALGEGILSDFIKVIPGNYSLSFYTRLENIMPVKSRLGIKMYDAVDVRVLYFDRNKIAIDGAQPFPQLNQQIDNSYKSLSLANFTSIPSFGWGKIIGKSADFPFPDGDIPTNAHYVKIYLGLKGTGTMWIDSVDFSYTLRNFSIEERMMAYSDTSQRIQPVIIPTPKKMERLESVHIAMPGDAANLPVIVIPAGDDPFISKAATVLQTALSTAVNSPDATKLPLRQIRVIPEDNARQLSTKGLVFVLGTTHLFQKYRKELPAAEIAGHSQGYYIYTPHDLPNVVFLGGNSSLGAYYAALSAVQLIDRLQPVFHNAQVVDYPDFENRYYTLNGISGIMESNRVTTLGKELAGYKLNGTFYWVKNNHDLEPGSPLQQFVDSMSAEPSFHMACILTTKTKIPAAFNSRLVVATRWIWPEDSSLCYPLHPDLTQDTGSPAALLKQTPDVPASRKLLLPAVYNNTLLDYVQFMGQTAGFEKGYTGFYSGSSFFSLNTDDADFNRYLSYSAAKPVFMDNSMLTSSPWGHYGGGYPYYAGKVRLYNIFEPYMNTGIHEHISQLDTSMFWINCPANSEIDVIRLATAADFMWNTVGYDPDNSLWKVLTARYGAEVARALIHYADEYGLLLEIELKLEKNEQIQRNLKNIRNDFSNLEIAFDTIQNMLGAHHPLVLDLLSLNAKLKSRLEKFTNSAVLDP